jgi:hypothetical protein
MEQDFYLIMLSGKPTSVLDLFPDSHKSLPLAFLADREEDLDDQFSQNDEHLLNGLLVAYPHGPKEGDVDLFRHYARLVIGRLVELRGYKNSFELISYQAVNLFQKYGKTPSKLAMITASMIEAQE